MMHFDGEGQRPFWREIQRFEKAPIRYTNEKGYVKALLRSSRGLTGLCRTNKKTVAYAIESLMETLEIFDDRITFRVRMNACLFLIARYRIALDPANPRKRVAADRGDEGS